MGGPAPPAGMAQPQQQAQQPFAGLGGAGGAPMAAGGMAAQQSRLPPAPKKAADPFADLLG